MKKQWAPQQVIELQYRSAVRSLINYVIRLARKGDGQDPNAFLRNWMQVVTSQEFAGFAMASASRMVTGLYASSCRTWREAAVKSTRGHEIYQLLKQELEGPVGILASDLILENAKKITSLPLDIARQANFYIANEAAMGKRPAEIAKGFNAKFIDIASTRLMLLVRTEVSASSTALTQARCEIAGLKCYEWTTAEDSRTRESHSIMDGVFVFWKEPPSPELLDGQRGRLGHYHAGCTPNCRCYPRPVIDIDAETWPHKVYHNGQTKMLTKEQFKQIAA